MRPTVLLDVDGVMAGFTQGYLEVVRELTGSIVLVDEVDTYEIHKCSWFVELERQHPELKAKIDDLITHDEGFCSGLQVLPGAAEGVAAIADAADVYAVTSPWHGSRYWHHERVDWLWEHARIPAKNVVFARAKHLVAGHVLVDDAVHNLEGWGHGRPLLWDQPWNRSGAPGGLERVDAWGKVLEAVLEASRWPG